MQHRRTVLTCIVAAAGLAASFAFAQPPADKAKPAAAQPAAKPADKAPAGQPQLTPQQQAAYKAMEEAGKTGPQHAFLQKSVGTWDGKVKMWEGPGTTPNESTCTTTISSAMDGRFVHCDTKGDMMGMPFHGMGAYGYDNVAQQFQSVWIDNMGTGMMNGTGVLSADKKTMTWTMNYNCPVTKKPAVMREVETYKSDNEMTLEMFGPDPFTGKEFKMMEISYARKGAAPAKAATPAKPTGK